jgi:hypothetical protein
MILFVIRNTQTSWFKNIEKLAKIKTKNFSDKQTVNQQMDSMVDKERVTINRGYCGLGSRTTMLKPTRA